MFNNFKNSLYNRVIKIDRFFVIYIHSEVFMWSLTTTVFTVSCVTVIEEGSISLFLSIFASLSCKKIKISD